MLKAFSKSCLFALIKEWDPKKLTGRSVWGGVGLIECGLHSPVIWLSCYIMKSLILVSLDLFFCVGKIPSRRLLCPLKDTSQAARFLGVK